MYLLTWVQMSVICTSAQNLLQVGGGEQNTRLLSKVCLCLES